MFDNAKRLYEIKEVLSINGGPLPISKAGIYLLVSRGEIPSVRLGKRVFIPSYFVEQLLKPPVNTKGA
ncbi:MAG: hypothetical protein ABFC57_09515 [Veillonellales bacterium]